MKRQIRKWRLGVLLGATGIIGTGTALAHEFQFRRQANLLAKQADDLSSNGKEVESLQVYQQYLNFRPKDGEVLGRYLNVLEKIAKKNMDKDGRYAKRDLKAIVDVSERMLLLEDDPSKRYELAFLLYDQGEWNLKKGFPYRAKELLFEAYYQLKKVATVDDKLFVKEPNFWEKLAVCENIFGETKNRKQYIVFLEKAIASAKSNSDSVKGKNVEARPETYFEVAQYFRFVEKTDDAKKYADQTINDLNALKKNDPHANALIARYWLKAKDSAKAALFVENVRKSTADNQVKKEVLIDAIDLELSERNYAEAKKVLSKATEKFPKEPKFLLQYAEVLLNSQEPSQAIEPLKKVLTFLDVKSKDGINNLVLALDFLLDFDERNVVLKELPRLEENKELHSYSDYIRGRLALQAGDFSVAKGYLESCQKEIIQIPGFAGKMYLVLAQCYQMEGNPELQLTAASQAIRNDPKLYFAKMVQADAFEKLGQTSQLMEVFRDSKSNFPDAKVKLAKALLQEQLRREKSQRTWSNLEAELKEELTLPEKQSESEKKLYANINADLTVIRAQMLIAQDRQAEAGRLIEKAAAEQPKSIAIQGALAQLLATTKNPAAGLSKLDEAVKSCGDHLEFRLVRLAIITQSPETSTTLSIFKIGDDVEKFSVKDRYQLWMAIGKTLSNQFKRPDDAKVMFKNAAELVKTDIPSRLALFDIAIEKNDFDKAEKLVKEFYEIEGEKGATYIVTKITMELPKLESKKPKEVIALRDEVNKAISRKPSWGRSYSLLGDLNFRLGNEDQALQNYRMAIDRGDQNPVMLKKTIRMLEQRKLKDQANMLRLALGNQSSQEMKKWGANWVYVKSNTAESLKSIDPSSKDPSDQILRAQLLVLNGNPKEADETFKKALNLPNGETPDNWLAYLRFLMSYGRIEDAKKSFKQAETNLKSITNEQNKGFAKLFLGECQEALGDLKQAEILYRESIAAGGDSQLAIQNLIKLLQRMNRRAEAETILESSLKTAPNDGTKRMLRRLLALSKVSHAQGYQFIGESLRYIEQNISEMEHIEKGGLIEDIRAKALIMAIDPTMTTQAKKLLLETATSEKFPLNSDENVLLARLYIRENNFEQAETTLIVATQTPNVQPEHLGLLAQIQSQMKKPIPAKATVDKLKLLAPASWDAMAEEARLLADAGNKSEAVKKMLSYYGKAEPVVLAQTIAPFFEEIGCHDEAEKLFERVLKETNAPNRHTFLAGFYLRHGKPQEAIQLALKYAATPDMPVDLSCRIMSGAVHSKPMTAIAQDSNWAKKVANVKKFIQAQVEKSPNNPGVRYAEAELADAEGRYDDSIAAYEAALTIQPGNSIYENNLAFLLAVHSPIKANNRPLELIENVIRKNGPSAGILDTRGVVHTAAGRYEDAIKDLSLALQLKQNPVYRFHLAVAYDGAGKSQMRDSQFRMAVDSENLTKVKLHPEEWATFDRLNAPPKKPNATK